MRELDGDHCVVDSAHAHADASLGLECLRTIFQTGIGVGLSMGSEPVEVDLVFRLFRFRRRQHIARLAMNAEDPADARLSHREVRRRRLVRRVRHFLVMLYDSLAQVSTDPRCRHPKL